MPRKRKLHVCDTSVTKKQTKYFNDRQTKMKVIGSFEEGLNKSEIGRKFNIPWSTVDCIIKRIEHFRKAAETVQGDVKLLFPRQDIFVEMEKLLVNWIMEEENCNRPINNNSIREKAVEIFQNLKTKDPSCKATFAGSKGWFYRFLKRTGLKSVVLDGETCVANTDDAQHLKNDFRNVFIEIVNDYKPEQVFYFCEVVLYWKTMPGYAFKASEQENAKDKLSILLGSNAVGDFRSKPLIVSSMGFPEDSRSDENEDSLPVIVECDPKPRITRTVFFEWFKNTFQPSVEEYLKEKSIDKKAVLLLDRIFLYSSTLDSMTDFIKVMRVPRNISSTYQPIDYRVPFNFKREYLKLSLEYCVEGCCNSDITNASEAWKSYNLKDAVFSIASAWNETRSLSLPMALKRLWSDQIFSGFDDASFVETTNKKIVELGLSLGLHFSEEELEAIIKKDIILQDIQNEIDEYMECSDDPADVTSSGLSSADLQQLFLCVDMIKKITENDPIRERGNKCYKSIESACLPYRTKLKRIEARENWRKTENSLFLNPAGDRSEQSTRQTVTADDFLFL